MQNRHFVSSKELVLYVQSRRRELSMQLRMRPHTLRWHQELSVEIVPCHGFSPKEFAFKRSTGRPILSLGDALEGPIKTTAELSVHLKFIIPIGGLTAVAFAKAPEARDFSSPSMGRCSLAPPRSSSRNSCASNEPLSPPSPEPRYC